MDGERTDFRQDLNIEELLEHAGEWYRRGDWDRALEYYSAALKVSETNLLSQRQGEILLRIGRILRRRGDWEGALDSYRKSLDLFKECENSEGEAAAYNSIGTVLFENGKWEEAEEYYHKGLEIAENLDDGGLIGEINNNLGALSCGRGDVDRAIVYYQDSIPRFERMGNPRGLAEAYHNLGMAFADKGDLARAREYYEKSLEISREIGEVSLTSTTYLNKAELHLDLQDMAEARNFADRAAEITRSVGDKLGLAEAYRIYGLISRENGDWKHAERFLTDALKLNEEYRSPLGMAQAYRELGLTYKREGESRKTLQMLSKSLNIFQELRARRDIRTLNKEIYELEKLYLSIIKQIAADVELRDPYTLGHSRRVAMYALAMANRLGLSEEEKKGIITAAYLHDVGKIRISPKILKKPGKLSQYEYELIKRHPALGVRVMQTVDFPWHVKPLVMHHHERFDGHGYPDGLRGSSIPIGARIIAIADVFDAMTSTRSYRPARSEEETVQTILEDSGTAFDPEIVDEFVLLVRKIYKSVKERDDYGEKPIDISELWEMSTCYGRDNPEVDDDFKP
jgi:putative nucleotidyltransferase with HDIG domain